MTQGRVYLNFFFLCLSLFLLKSSHTAHLPSADDFLGMARKDPKVM